MKLSTLFLSIACLVATASPALAQSRFSYSSDGSEVTDSKTGLVWRRCVEGMTWSGSTCTGTAGWVTHEAALLHAKTQTGWRLPSVRELASIVDRSRKEPAIDITAFPGTPPANFWSSSPYVGDPASAWYVGFAGGSIYPNLRDCCYGGPVRLVR